MKAYTCDSGVLRALCKAKKRWGMMIHGHDPDFIVRDAPYLDYNEHLDVITQHWGILLFKTRKALEKHYSLTSGDDSGGTVYAITCNPRGELLNENT